MELLLGHLIGDYLLQSDWMALNKKKRGSKGFLPCIIHCILWTLSVYIFTVGFKVNITIFILLFLSHYILDRTNIVKYIINKTIMPNPTMWKIIIVDNTLHLLFAYFILKLL